MWGPCMQGGHARSGRCRDINTRVANTRRVARAGHCPALAFEQGLPAILLAAWTPREQSEAPGALSHGPNDHERARVSRASRATCRPAAAAGVARDHSLSVLTIAARGARVGGERTAGARPALTRAALLAPLDLHALQRPMQAALELLARGILWLELAAQPAAGAAGAAHGHRTLLRDATAQGRRDLHAEQLAARSKATLVFAGVVVGMAALFIALAAAVSRAVSGRRRGDGPHAARCLRLCCLSCECTDAHAPLTLPPTGLPPVQQRCKKALRRPLLPDGSP